MCRLAEVEGKELGAVAGLVWLVLLAKLVLADVLLDLRVIGEHHNTGGIDNNRLRRLLSGLVLIVVHYGGCMASPQLHLMSDTDFYSNDTSKAKLNTA